MWSKFNIQTSIYKKCRRNNTFQIIYLPMRFKKCTIINLIHDHFDSNFCNIDIFRLIMWLVEWIFHKMFDIGLITVCMIQILLNWLTRILWCHCHKFGYKGKSWFMFHHFEHDYDYILWQCSTTVSKACYINVWWLILKCAWHVGSW